MVWSPLSNLLLYGATADVAAAQAAGVSIGLGSDWSPAGSKNLLGELKVARLVKRPWRPAPSHRPRSGGDGDPERLRDARLGRRHRLGRRREAWPTSSSSPGRAATRTTTCCAPRMPISLSSWSMAWLVSGNAELMAEIAPEHGVRGGADRWSRAPAAADRGRRRSDHRRAHALAARARLTDALGDLAALALRLEHPPVGAAAAALSDPTPRWFLQLDIDEPPGIAIAPHLPGSDGRPTAMVPPMPGAAAIPLSKLLEPMTLDPLSVADEPGYWARLASQPTIPEPIRAALAALD